MVCPFTRQFVPLLLCVAAGDVYAQPASYRPYAIPWGTTVEDVHARGWSNPDGVSDDSTIRSECHHASPLFGRYHDICFEYRDGLLVRVTFSFSIAPYGPTPRDYIREMFAYMDRRFGPSSADPARDGSTIHVEQNQDMSLVIEFRSGAYNRWLLREQDERFGF